jgi:hypothetical protein
MKSGDTIQWFGYPVELVKYVCQIGDNIYWLAIALYRDDKRVEIYSVGERKPKPPSPPTISRPHVPQTPFRWLTKKEQRRKKKQGRSFRQRFR